MSRFVSTCLRTIPKLFLFFFISTFGCEPGDIRVMLLAYDYPSDSYRFKESKLTTLDDLEKLEGEATSLHAGADLKLDYQRNTLTWRAAGHSVAFGAIEKDGVLIPEDFDSLVMVSIYYNIELSMLFFEELGLEEIGTIDLPTYYWPKFTVVDEQGEEQTFQDTALYMRVDKNHRAFFIVPFEEFDCWIPMGINTGVVVHEYSHAVFDLLVYDQVEKTGEDLTPSASNFLLGVNEGFADYMAVSQTADPDFIQHSIHKGYRPTICNNRLDETVRDASVPINYTMSIDRAARILDPGEFCPYEIGAFFSSLMYEIAVAVEENRAGDREIPSDATRYKVSKWLLEAIRDFGQKPDSNFEIWNILNLFIKRISTESDITRACDVINERYLVGFENIQGC